MTTTWAAGKVAGVIREFMVEGDVLLTFDEGGVSGHPNHISLLHGAREYISHLPPTSRPELWTLQTVGLFRKYTFVLDALWSVFSGKKVFISNPRGVRTAQKAMTDAHVSQMKWFRWGWIGLSRYMVVNTLTVEEV